MQSKKILICKTLASQKLMSAIKIRIDYLFFGGIGLVLLLSMLTADFLDPTVFNQLYPSEGIRNWMGSVGALIGGSLLEIFGPSALLFPWLFVRTALHQPRQVSGLAGTYHAFVLVFLLSIIYEVVLRSGNIKTVELEFFWQNGYAGVLAVSWLEHSINFTLGLSALAVMLIFSIIQMIKVLSPLPFIYGLIKVGQKLLSLLSNKKTPPPPAEILSDPTITKLQSNSHG